MAHSELLAQVISAGSAAWPELRLEPSRIAQHLERLGLRAPVAHPGDLYLACGCAELVPAALARFERTVLVKVPAWLGRVLADPDLIADVQQSLRETLLWRGTRPGKIADYRGEGALDGWVGVIAVRAALKVQRGEARFERLASEADEIAAGPEGPLLASRYGPAFQAATEAALAALSESERRVLRRYFLEGRTIIEIGQEIGVHAATVFRRIQALRRRLQGDVRARLRADLGVTDSELESLLRGVESHLDVHLSQALES